MSTDPAGRRVAVLGGSGTLQILDQDLTRVVSTLPAKRTIGLAPVLRFSPDSSFLALNSSYHLEVWRVSDHQVPRLVHLTLLPILDYRQSLADNPQRPLRVSFSPDGSHVAALSPQNVSIWKIGSPDLRVVILGEHKGEVINPFDDVIFLTHETILTARDGTLERWSWRQDEAASVEEPGREDNPLKETR